MTIVAITGMGGVGKSELARKYVDEHKDDYEHIIWINAANFETMKSSFQDLSKKIFLYYGCKEEHETIPLYRLKLVEQEFSLDLVYSFRISPCDFLFSLAK